jgi:hypothetical protein
MSLARSATGDPETTEGEGATARIRGRQRGGQQGGREREKEKERERVTFDLGCGLAMRVR